MIQFLQHQHCPPNYPSSLQRSLGDVATFARCEPTPPPTLSYTKVGKLSTRTNCHTITTRQPPPLQRAELAYLKRLPLQTQANTTIHSIEPRDSTTAIGSTDHSESSRLKKWRRLACTFTSIMGSHRPTPQLHAPGKLFVMASDHSKETQQTDTRVTPTFALVDGPPLQFNDLFICTVECSF
ncbi:hypothetical protein TcWFU_004531 [Taenia crassiceps]|uniref:Uncharacterized protein n=1 Tax=Taenia crassiceps TaxID=6207 RepID=A0ABR4QBE1_9CEST